MPRAGARRVHPTAAREAATAPRPRRRRRDAVARSCCPALARGQALPKGRMIAPAPAASPLPQQRSTFSYCAWTASTASAVAFRSVPAAAAFSPSAFAHRAAICGRSSPRGRRRASAGGGGERLARGGHLAGGGGDGRPVLRREGVVVDRVERDVERVELLHRRPGHAHQSLVARVERLDRLEQARLGARGGGGLVAGERLLQRRPPGPRPPACRAGSRAAAPRPPSRRWRAPAAGGPSSS